MHLGKLLRATTNRGVRLVRSQQEVQHDLVEASRILQLRSVACLRYHLQPSGPVQSPADTATSQLVLLSSQHGLSHLFVCLFLFCFGHTTQCACEETLVPLNRKRLLHREQLVVVSPHNQHILHSARPWRNFSTCSQTEVRACGYPERHLIARARQPAFLTVPEILASLGTCLSRP